MTSLNHNLTHCFVIKSLRTSDINCPSISGNLLGVCDIGRVARFGMNRVRYTLKKTNVGLFKIIFVIH